MAGPTENKSLTDVVRTETPAHEPAHTAANSAAERRGGVPPHGSPAAGVQPQSIRLIDEVVAGNRLLAVTLQTDPDLEQPRPDQLLRAAVLPA